MKALDEILEKYLPDDYYEEIRRKLKPGIIDWGKQICKEQRLNCAKALYGHTVMSLSTEKIIKAPEPEY